MTPMESAMAIIALLTPYLTELGKSVAKKAGEAAWEKTAALHQAIKRRFAQEQDSDFLEALEKFEKQPETRRGGFQDMLVELLQKDPAFAASLTRLLREAQGDQSSSFTTIVSGGEVGEIFNIDRLEGGFILNKGKSTPTQSSNFSGDADELETHTQLRRNLTTHFNISELRSLCQDLRVDHENLASGTKEELARELVLYCARHGRIPELIATCQKLRPLITNWET